ncbi:FAD-binding domain-containing protein [Schizophyllum commune H4-8]|uniref:FAD-binding domain-containing protein n=1 Tax=Schizophyllum commune (strain H4-8 / FGSC 9210) TaxID=578458 RepID=UPI00215E4872|nr:FAD-binding domain-containing protein [Schizophyllum commune H4-8]KAI5886875.1 FAD-binding domain-containing protein [Schizophyllum commune H4-8]
MSLLSIALGVAATALPSFASTPPILLTQTPFTSAATDACQIISDAISDASHVYYPWDSSGHYAADIEHYSPAATEISACSVEPATSEDIALILRVLDQTRTPFAVKGGGHSMNVGFSSTTGVQIAMTRFSEVTYDEETETAVVGAGLIWDDVYAALDPLGRGVVGGRVPGIGVAGFILGGGYSWYTNERGLALDNVLAFELVKPNGEVILISEKSDSDLFFVLKGGYNNYGIVTRFTLKTYPQGKLWGGHAFYSPDLFDRFSDALYNFSENTADPKASLIGTYSSIKGKLLASIFMAYLGPSPPDGIFDEFLDMPMLESNISTRDGMLPLILTAASNASDYGGTRALYSTTPMEEYTPGVLAFAAERIKNLSAALSPDDFPMFAYYLEPFVPDYLSRAPGNSSAYPPSRKKTILPTAIGVGWSSPSLDDKGMEVIKGLGDALSAYASDVDGQDLSGYYIYPNYALADVQMEDMYGENLEKMREVRDRVDPNQLMALAGGFKV